MSSFIGIRNKNIHLCYSLNRHRRNRDDKPGDTAVVAVLRLKNIAQGQTDWPNLKMLKMAMPHFNNMSNNASVCIHISSCKKKIAAFIAQT